MVGDVAPCSLPHQVAREVEEEDGKGGTGGSRNPGRKWGRVSDESQRAERPHYRTPEHEQLVRRRRDSEEERGRPPSTVMVRINSESHHPRSRAVTFPRLLPPPPHLPLLIARPSFVSGSRNCTPQARRHGKPPNRYFLRGNLPKSRFLAHRAPPRAPPLLNAHLQNNRHLRHPQDAIPTSERLPQPLFLS